MRLILILGLLFRCYSIHTQTVPVRIMSVEDAITAALNNIRDTTPENIRRTARDIKSAWYRWIYQIHEQKTVKEYVALLEDIGRVASLRYEEGDIELLEKSGFLAKQAELKAKNAVLRNEIQISGNLLRQFTRTAAEIIPADTGLSLYQVHKGIENDPLQASPDTSLALENLRLELDNCFIKYQYYKTIGLDHARLIIKVNRAKYEAEEIDYLEFTKNLDEAYSVMLVYLETVNLYNQTAIELEYEAF